MRAAIEELFGSDQPVQGCRHHKIRNVLDELPRERHAQTRNLMRAAWQLTDADEGGKRLEQLARFLEHEHESAARSLREGMAEMFTIQRLKLPSPLYKCLGTTNVIESPQSGVRNRTNNVTRWRTAEMVQRWVASAWLLTEPHFRKVSGCKDFWALSVILGREQNPNVTQEKWRKMILPAAVNLQLRLDIRRGFSVHHTTSIVGSRRMPHSWRSSSVGIRATQFHCGELMRGTSMFAANGYTCFEPSVAGHARSSIFRSAVMQQRRPFLTKARAGIGDQPSLTGTEIQHMVKRSAN